MLEKLSRNVVRRTFSSKKRSMTYKFLLISDLHWDNPHCDRETLKKDLDQAVKEDARILINGDLFCLMQGRYDPRRNRRDIRPEHDKANYLDCVIEDAAQWFAPYAHHIDFIGYGNHETTIIKNLETDPIQRFADLVNTQQKSTICVGGYSGWYVVVFDKIGNYKIWYHHGFGGGGPVTKGTIQNNRKQTSVHGADLMWMGHVHEDYELTYTHEYLDLRHQVKLKDTLHVRTATYKEEYDEGYGGYHIIKGRPPKPVGGRWLEVTATRADDGSVITGKTYKT